MCTFEIIINFRKQQKSIDHSYDVVSDLENKNSDSVIEMVPNPPETETSSLALTNSIIEDTHDHSENDKDIPNKISMKNVLYEPGKCRLLNFCYAVFSTYVHMNL